MILAFAGKIGSGKTTLAKAVADILGCPLVSFGNYVRTLAQSSGLDANSRKVLQDMGEALIREDCRRFCEGVLAQAEWTPGNHLVIDGVRHRTILTTIKALVAPDEVRLIFVDLDEEVRTTRLANAGFVSEQIARFDSHSTEHDVNAVLRDIADLVLDASRPIQELTDVVRSAAGNWMRPSL